MARPITLITDSFKIFKDNVNTVSVNVGDPDLLTTTTRAGQRSDSSDIVSAINELDSDLHGSGGGDVKNDLNYLSYAINTVRDSGMVGAINAIDALIGGDSDVLPTSAKTLIFAIKELDSDLHGVGGGNAKADLTTSAKTIVDAINEIEAVFDASATEINSPSSFEAYVTGDFTIDASGDIILDADGANVTLKDGGVTRIDHQLGSTNIVAVTGNYTLDVSGNIVLDADNGNIDIKDGGVTRFAYGLGATNTLDITGNIVTNVSGSITDSAGTSITQKSGTTFSQISGGNFTTTVTGNYSVDASGNVILDADAGDVLLRDGGSQYGSLTNNSGHLVIKTGTDSALTFDATNATFNKTLYTDSALDTNAKSVAGGINELETAARGANTDYSLSTTAQNFRDAIREHETDIGNMVFTGLSATNISAALRELRAELGDHTALVTETDSNAVAAINELHSDIGDIALLSVNDSEGSGTTATNLVTALNFLDYRLDSVETLLDQAVKTTSDVLFNSVETPLVKRTGNFTLDVSADIILDAGGADVLLKDDGTQYGALTNTSGNLIIKSGTTTAATFNGANVTFAGTIAQGTSLNTSASTLGSAINEIHDELDSASGEISSHASRLNDLESDNSVLNTFVEPTQSLSTNATTLADAVNELDSDIGNLDLLEDSVYAGSKNNVVTALNAAAALLLQLDSNSGFLDNAIGSLNNLAAFFDSAGATSSVVNALNHLASRVVDVYDETGTLLNT